MAHLRFHTQYDELSSVFGRDWFGRRAEAFARSSAPRGSSSFSPRS
jgi:hypothetical protein